MKYLSLSLIGLLAGCLSGSHLFAQDTEVGSRIQVRKGYQLTVAQSELFGPRFMEMDPNGTLYVSFPGKGEIQALRDQDGDGFYEWVKTFVEGHKTVHGMYWHEGWLWYTETGAILKARDTDMDGVADEKETIIPEGELAKGGGHWWRPILIIDDRLYTAIGCSGNINDETDTERLKIWSYKLDGTDKQLFASGLRNTEKLVQRPGTQEIWGMDHGSDWFGREIEGNDRPNGQPITDWNPPGEMNHYVAGGFYGHPYITGNKVPRYEYRDREDIVEWANKTIPPAWPTGAHWAPNAMEFYSGDQFPEDAKGDAFVAFHGSWNRSHRAGYKVARVFFDEGQPYGQLTYVNFITDEGEVLGRPVDIVNAPDGSILISDDSKSRIYRLSYVGE